jgi:hypothetical protein
MECATRNHLVLSYMRCRAEKDQAEKAARIDTGITRLQKALEAARSQVTMSRKELLEHCDRHGC